MKLEFFSNPARTEQMDSVELSETLIGAPGDGEEFPIYARNVGGGIRALMVGLEGEGAQNVQLAIDADGEPGVWADAGQPITIKPGETIFRDEEFAFWARPRYLLEDHEGLKDFSFVLKGVSVG